jgi:Group II intron, maturase-specific domain
MSKEITINFNTMLWSSSSWDRMYLYITKFKSRIYKATYLKLTDKKNILQNLLISAPTAKIVALHMVHKSVNNFALFEPSDLSQDFFIQRINIFKLSVNSCILFGYKDNLNLKVSKNVEFIVLILIIFILEPELNARQDKEVSFIQVEYPQDSIDTVRSIMLNENIRLYVLHLHLLSYFKGFSIGSIVARLNLKPSLGILINNRIHNALSTTIISNIPFRLFFEVDNFEFKLTKLLLRFMAYLLCSEISYITSSSSLSSNLINKSYCKQHIINYGVEVLLCNISQSYLTLWLQVFLRVSSLNSLKKKSNYSAKIYTNHQFNFLGYHFDTKNEIFVCIMPSKDYQILLLNKIEFIFHKLKSDSVIRLINSLNYVLLVWGNYFAITKSYKTFALIDYLIYLKLRAWMFRKHPNWGRKRIIQKYFYHRYKKLSDRNVNIRWGFSTKGVILDKPQRLFLYNLRSVLMR